MTKGMMPDEELCSNIAEGNPEFSHGTSSPRLEKINEEIETGSTPIVPKMEEEIKSSNKQTYEEIEFMENEEEELMTHQKPNKFFIKKKLEEMITNNLIYLQC
jgi:hypothetical protein